ncbi:WAT1-related protein At1g25270-like isoform X1 [Vigna umbellata]|uniref:WAT1-related protein At1g25270-like isoform X1 n=1 Tax=Vigna umbellata TaxID=87088 RepID=UPI001F5EDAC6|nr:WAT1-related protein At1g25270-like isoform X1 [Vigna umbellata]
MRDIGKVVHGLKPALLMLMVQIAFASVNVLYKLAINDGMSVRIITAYRLIFAAASTVPLALIFERKNIRTLTWRVILKSFFCGLFGGSLFQNLYFESLKLISATFASAVFNLIPAVTFILAVTSGFEKLNFQRAAGKAKVLGTITGVGGAMMLTFLKGVEINIWTSHINLLHKKGTTETLNGDSGSKLLGVFCGLGSCLCFALWLIIQAQMSKEFPGHHSSTALMSTMGAIQATVFALCIEKDWSQWRLGWNIRLLASAYSGIVASGIMVVVIAWCVRMRGPLYASVFNPLLLVLVAVAGSLMLDEKLYVGSVMGAVLIVMGLYMVLWGKSKEMKRVSDLETTPEIEEIEVVVTCRATEDDKSNDKYNCSERNIIEKCNDNASKSRDEGQDNESNGKEDMGSSGKP